jgi:hypothetical protein
VSVHELTLLKSKWVTLDAKHSTFPAAVHWAFTTTGVQPCPPFKTNVTVVCANADCFVYVKGVYGWHAVVPGGRMVLLYNDQNLSSRRHLMTDRSSGSTISYRFGINPVLMEPSFSPLYWLCVAV